MRLIHEKRDDAGHRRTDMPTFTDLVDDIHRQLMTESDQYRGYLQATDAAHAVEGSIAMDDACAARMIREKAREIGAPEVAQEKIAVITRALGVVLRRYHASRTQRRIVDDRVGD